MFGGVIFLPVVIFLLISVVVIYLFATRRIKLALILLITFLLPVAGLAFLNIDKKITERKLTSVSESIPTYKQSVITSNYYREMPIISFFDYSGQREGVMLSIKESGKTDQVEVVRFYDNWFKENGWTKTVTDVSFGQHHYVNNNVSVHLWLRDLNSWTIEINRR